MRADLREALAAAPDFLRALARLSLDRGGPRDLAALRDGLRVASAAVASSTGAAAVCRPSLAASLRPAPPRPTAHLERETRGDALADELPLEQARRRLRARRRQRAARRGARAARRKPARHRRNAGAILPRRPGSRQLKIKHNNFLGFYIETPQAQGEALLRPPHSATFIHRQTMAGAMRFTTNALIELESEDRLGRRSRARARTGDVRAAAAGVPRRRRRRCAASARRSPRSTSPPRWPNSPSSATGRGPHVDDFA